ncbi:MAG: hypothetical protein JSU86_10450 [Phycisphaerales bacterium]|nr:MAG: hypothetical protein JSU86_10450 [Phycisphaerales bacterium]
MDDLLIGTLAEVVRALGDVGIAYAVTGSVASSVHGEPFASLDVDLVLTATDTQACAIARILSPRFYAPEDMLMEAAQTHTFANLVDNRTGVKVDLSFVPRTGFVSHAIERRVKRRVGSEGPEFDFVTPEDVILMKLLWRKDTLSQKQWENALGVVRVKTVSLDWKYLFEQARSLGIEDDLIKLRDEAGV